MPGSTADGDIYIDFGTTQGIAGQLLSASRAVQTALDNLHSAIKQWETTCVGMDKGAFEGKFVEWGGYVSEAAQYVQSHASLLDSISEDYGAMDRTLANNWGNLNVI